MPLEAPTPTAAAFHADLVAAGHTIELGTPGLVGRSHEFEQIVAGLVAGVRARRGAGEVVTDVQFPPVETQVVCERSDYVDSFPQLIGAVRVFDGADADHADLLARRGEGVDWTDTLVGSGLTLVPAACHPLYGALAGQSFDQPRRYGLGGYCFRHEPSHDPARMLSFRIQEEIFVGDPDGAVAHREAWLERLRELLVDLGLEVTVDTANDPFFGRAGRLMKASQRVEALKFEILADVAGRSTAIASGNAHRDHFGVGFDLRGADGQPAHSACAGLGLERAALALLWRHGIDVDAWPKDIRDRLGL